MIIILYSPFTLIKYEVKYKIMFKNIVNVISRVMLSYLFIVAGYGKLIGYEATLNYMQSMHVPSIFLPLVILLELGGGIAIILGLFTRLTSICIAIFSIVAAIIFHQGSDDINSLMFMKDIGIAGGFIMLALNGADKFSVDYLIKKRFLK